ncbi:ribonuclease E activity regulator RraA [Cypionkella psychrotolerans]|uniref:ribonuclease E activity regulator RraA n=1 Tax=Cypionkella psychrotolerans TaxID=1678131 RepID=UPI0006B46585|nr:ribonuclease E activity regulator RraA [Cypionkella psychrotolerans]
MLPTADLFDAHPDLLAVCDTQFRSFGGQLEFDGPCSTLATFEDHTPVLEVLKTPGLGRVLVVDGRGSLRVGLMGDRLAGIAVENGWAGVIINGAIRDSAGIDALPLGVRALGTTARRGFQATQGHPDVKISFGGVTFAPGNWVYADRDCVVLAELRLPER